MLRLLSRSNPGPIPRIPLNTNQLCLTLSAFTHGTAVRAVFIHISRPQHAHGHTHTAARKPKSLLFVFYNLKSRDPDVEDAHYGYTGHDSAPQAEEMSRSASGLLGFICTNSKLRLPLRFSDKKSERRDRNRGRRYLQQDYREEK